VLPGITMVYTPGHSVGYMAVTVATSAGDIVIAGDAIFEERNLEPNPEEGWRYWVPTRFVNSYEGWKSVEEIDKPADYVRPCHDHAANPRSDAFPYPGMPLRTRRQVIPGFQFYFGDMPPASVGRAAPAMTRAEVKSYLAGLTHPKDMVES
jgi:N-acyl homoserine lactone hydrolase